MVLKSNQVAFEKAFGIATEFNIVLETVAIARNTFDLDLSTVQARKVLEWYFNSYVENIKKEAWDEEILVKMLEEFVSSYASEKLTRKKK